MTQSSAALRKQSEALVVLERFLPYRLNVLASLTSNALAQIYAERFDLTIPGWRVVATLGQYEFRTARDIATHAVMHKSTVSRAVAVLEGRGLVVRRPNTDDRREELLELTPEGRAIYEALAPEALSFEDRLLSVLSRDEQSLLWALVDKLGRHARSLAPEEEGRS
ncbi:MarR family winged helix-turn-helix transcriptional regulator [Microvirga sp. 2MCAF38]|uniref:MarR family winged helix-turn-helix transcriptional regulator n=1 Tax=Microvirga sp. 2MCAF38 TaxID=3232989 RepID=UPI003F9C32B9